MIKHLAVTAMALVLLLGIVGTAYAQNETISDNQTTTETGGEISPFETLNGTVPETSIEGVTPGDEGGLQGNESTEPVPFPPAPEVENQSDATETVAQNLTQVKEEAIPLLDQAETNIQDARDLIASLQEALAEAQGGNVTEDIITDANQSAEDIIEVVEDAVNDTATVDEAGNVTEDVITVINDTIQGNDNATADQVQNASDTVVDVIDEVTDNIDNSTAEGQVQSALVRRLTGLVNAQDFNQNLTQDEKNALKADLQDTIAEQAESAADALRG